MTAKRRVPVRAGQVTSAVRAYLADLGVLSPRQRIQARTALRLAAVLDSADTGAGAAAASRELRVVLGDLLNHPAQLPAPAAPAAATPAAQPARSPFDELAAQRAKRLADQQGAD